MGAIFYLIAFVCALLALIGVIIPGGEKGILIVLMFISLGLLVGGVSISWPVVRKA